jgi:hypothetical protein
VEQNPDGRTKRNLKQRNLTGGRHLPKQWTLTRSISPGHRQCTRQYYTEAPFLMIDFRRAAEQMLAHGMKLPEQGVKISIPEAKELIQAGLEYFT